MKGYLVFILLLLGGGLKFYAQMSSDTIRVNGLNKLSFCAEDSVAILYSGVDTVGTNRVYTAELSDENGSFASPILIGTSDSSASGVIYGVIPAWLNHGLMYRVRVVSTDSAEVAIDNGSNIAIYTFINTQCLLSQNASLLCGNAVLTLTLQAFPALNHPQIIWETSTDSVNFQEISGFGGLVYTTNTLNPGKHFFRVKTEDSVALCFTYSNILSVVVTPPVLNINLFSGGVPICSGNPVALTTNVPSFFHTAPTTFQWQVSSTGTSWSNISGATQVIYNSVPLQGTRYFRVLFRAVPGCAQVISQVFTVPVNPTPNLTVNPTSFSICEGGAKTLIASAQGTINYTWTPASGLNTNTGSTVIASPSVSTLYTVTAINPLTSCYKSASINILVNPDAMITAITGKNATCTGGSVLLTSNVSGGLGACSVNWQESNNGINWNYILIPGTTTNYSGTTYQTPPLTANKWYRSRVSSCTGVGCGSSGFGSPFLVTVSPVHQVSVLAPSEVCTGGTANLTAVLTGGTGLNAYTWQSSSDSLSWSNVGGNGPNYSSYNLQSSRYFRVIVFNNGVNCGVDTSGVKSIIVRPQGSVILTGGNSFCGSGFTVLNANVSGGAGSSVIQWQTYQANSWTNIPGVTGSSWQTPVHTTTKNYRVNVSFSGSGCSSKNSNAQNVTIFPTPSLLFSPHDTITMCSGGGRLVSVSGASTYSWLPNTGMTQTSGNQVWVQPSLPSVFTVIGTSSAGCKDTANLLVNIIPDPVVMLSGSSFICNGNSTVLTAQINQGTGICSYQWQTSQNGLNWVTINGFNTSSYTTPSLTTAQYYRVRAINCSTIGCNAFSPFSQTFKVDVGFPPEVILTATPSETCKNGDGYLYAKASGASNRYQWQWEQSLDSVYWTSAEGNGSSLYFNGLQSKTYYRVIVNTTAPGCLDTSEVTSVRVKPKAEINISGNAAYCGNGSTTFSATLSGGIASDYMWQTYLQNEWVNIPGAVTQTYTTPVANEHRYYRVISQQPEASCDIPKSNGKLLIYSLPVMVFASYNSIICHGDTAMLNASGAESFEWSIGQGYNAGNEPLFFAHPSVTQNYSLTGVNTTTGCSSTDSVLISVLTSPSLSLTGGGTYADSTFVTATAELNGGNIVPQFMWEVSADSVSWTSLSGEDSSEYSFFLTEPMYVRVTVSGDSLNCAYQIQEATSFNLLNNARLFLSSKGVEAEESITLWAFPNPFSSTLTLSISNLQPEMPIEINLLTIQGEVINKINAYSPTDSFRQTLNLSNLPQGVYVIRVKSGKQYKELKVVKNK